MKRILPFLLPVCLAAAPPLDPAWIFSPEAKAPALLPQAEWAGDGTLLLEDLRKPAKDRVLERLDPATGARAPLVDGSRVLARIKALPGSRDVPEALPWPEGLDQGGKRALYHLGEAWYVVDLASAEVHPLGGAEAAALSPDGARVALARDHDLWIRDLPGGPERRVTADGSSTVLNGTFSWVYWEEIFDHRDAAFWWSPDSRTLAFLRTDESAVPLHSFTDFKPWQAAIHPQRYPQAGQPNPVVRLGFAPAGGGAAVWMGGAPFEYLVSVAWTPSGRVSVETLDRAQQTLDLDLVDPAQGAPKRVLEERSDTWVHFYEPHWLEDGRVLWASDRSGYNQLYRFEADGRLLNPVSNGDGSLWPWGQYSGGHSGLLDVDEGKGEARFAFRAEGGPDLQLWKARLDGTGLQRISRGEGTHGVSFSPRHDFYLDAWSSLTRTPSLTLHRADGSVVAVLAESRPLPDLPRPGILHVRAADGFEIPLWILKPRNLDPSRRHPVIFSVYGGPGAPSVRDSWDPALLDQVLASAGYVVVAADNRSSAGIGMKYEAQVKGRLYGDTELKDLLAAVDWVKAQPWADPDRLGIWGWSGGGTYTLSALTRSKAFRAGISVAPVTDWRYYDSVYTEMILKRPGDNPEGYRATSQVATAKDPHGRLLLVNGTFDDNVHPQNAQAFEDALVEAGIPFEMMVYPMRKHGISDKAARLHLYRTMLDFWKRNL
jgi:dipeptidyl-peptidase-4